MGRASAQRSPLSDLRDSAIKLNRNYIMQAFGQPENRIVRRRKISYSPAKRDCCK
jgi:hypothetical protein